jgi:hypothetical protein
MSEEPIKVHFSLIVPNEPEIRKLCGQNNLGKTISNAMLGDFQIRDVPRTRIARKCRIVSKSPFTPFVRLSQPSPLRIHPPSAPFFHGNFLEGVRDLCLNSNYSLFTCMTLFDIFEFIFRFSISVSDTATWIYVLTVFLGVSIGTGLLWGKMWNREWGFSDHLGSLLMVGFFAILCAYSVFNLRGVSRVDSWMKDQRTTLARSTANSGQLNRDIVRSTWTQLSTSGGQEGLTPPDQGGNEIRLNNPEEAFALASTAAEETRSALRTKMPFVIGAPLSTKSSNEIATEAVDSVQFSSSRYPTVVPADNEWSKTSAILQTNHALDTSYDQLKPRLEDLRTASIWLLVVSLLLPAILIPMGAIQDIKVDPKG